MTADGRQRHVPQPPSPAGAVERRGLVELLVDLGQRGQEDDGGPAALLPDELDDHERPVEVGIADDRDAADAEVGEPAVEHTGTTEHVLEQGDDDHPGQEVRQVDDALHEAAQHVADDAVQQQRQGERRREEEDQLEYGDEQRVADGAPEARVVDHPLEVGQADPFAVAQSQERHVLLERQCVAEQ
jgi:hypothetical protein